MGLAVGDYDADGWQDLYVSHFYEESNTLYRNLGNQGFEDVTGFAGLHDPTLLRLGFGTVMRDFNQDGWQDLFVTNGHIENYPGIVMYTLGNEDLRRQLEDCCARLNMPAIAVLDPIQATLSSYLGASIRGKAGAQRVLDADYYRRIEAMNYSMAHDDGAGDDYASADVILLGISRTSKTPTSIYLGHRGIRTANIPIVPGAVIPETIFTLKKPLIVGLTATPERIVQIRRNRLLNLNEERSTGYVEEDAVREEVVFAKRLFARHGWPSIEVTRRSIEETAAKIINLLNEHRTKRTS
jgi:regulator of PEP synthase PpsR (kinase-PPPase family)